MVVNETTTERQRGGERESNEAENVDKEGGCLGVGTWNVRTMNREGKLENIKSEMERNKINVLGISQVRWKDGGEFESDGYRVLYAGEKECQRGVAIILDRTCANKVSSVERYGDRIILVKLQAEPVNMCIVQIYMPTSEHSDEEVEQIYDQIEELIKRQKGTENLLIMGD